MFQLQEQAELVAIKAYKESKSDLGLMGKPLGLPKLAVLRALDVFFFALFRADTHVCFLS